MYNNYLLHCRLLVYKLLIYPQEFKTIFPLCRPPQKPGDRGWVGRARVPMPSTNDYVVRPKWNVDQKLPRKTSKKVMNRYEKQIQKDKQRKTQNKTTHAVSISVEGRNMPL